MAILANPLATSSWAPLETTSAAALPTTLAALLYPADWRWNADLPHGSAVTVTYSFMTAPPSGYSGFSVFDAAEKAAARAALADWADVCNVTFQEVASGGQIAFGNASLGGPTGYTAWSGTTGANSGYKTTHADVLINGSAGLTFEPGSAGLRTMIHEIGHALGLKHTFDSSGPTLSGVENTAQYSVMSYANAPSTPSAQPETPQAYDVAAVQYLYGARASHTGNDVWQLPANRTALQTIWDAGGTDSLSAANQAKGCTIDLNAGHFSDIGPYGSGTAHDNLCIAAGTVIENATGSGANDTLIGNAVGNVLTGGGGADLLTGGGGADIFAYAAPGQGGDTITDFQSGTDRLQFDATAFHLAAGSLPAANFVKLAGTFSGGSYAAGHPTFIVDGTGTLYWEDTNATTATRIATLQGATLAASDIVIGGVSSPTPTPTPATVYGTGGNDRLTGGGTADTTMVGKLGNDTYVLDSLGDKVVENSGEGVDTVQSPYGYILGGYVENLTLTGTNAIDGTGSGWHNAITGNGAANRLSGLAGNDTLDGRGGNDQLIGGAGHDRLTGGGGGDSFKYLSPGDGGVVGTNVTRGTVAGDTITDFTTGVDKVGIDHTAFALVQGTAVNGGNFVKIATAYNGANAGGAEWNAGHAALVLDSTGTLYYDANGKGAGYTVLASFQSGANLHASDIVIA